MNASDILKRRAELTPDREALFDLHTGVRYTYADLNRRANRAANFLRRRFNIQKGDRVSILAQNSLPFMDLLFGLGKLGAIFAPLNWRLTASELIYIINDLQPSILVCGPEYVQVLEEMKGHIHVASVISLERAPIPNALEYETLLAEADDTEPEQPEVHPDDGYCILYTSGTTGKPKGAVLPHRQVLWNSFNTIVSWGLSEKDVSPILTPMFHSGGLFVFLVPLFHLGGRIVMTRSFDPEESLKTIMAEECTVILGVPTLFQVWMNSSAFSQADFKHVHYFISGGAPCPPALIRSWQESKGVIMRQGYGLTEVGVNCFTMTDEEALQKAGSVGKPIFHSQMRLVDEDGIEVPFGQTGELTISGPTVCAGYWNDPVATAQSLRNGWFHTGDMARQDEDGFFYIVGRLKDMIISGGENIYAAEVETVFREHNAVEDAALIGLPDEKWGEIGLMVVTTKPGNSVTADELIDHCRKRLARYKVPKRIEFVRELPYTPYGKVIKAELYRRYGVVN
ncbi:MAG TPA: long-chain fatty acid--CoA ligase [Anaerolineales bacterium]|nr:long-chain fatty acid--CoA ligase [Anaerolineales bacterium]